MQYDPERQHRRSIRLRGYDYSRVGAYFVTICVHDRECLLGDIAAGTVKLSDLGSMIDHSWQEIPTRFPSAVLDLSIVMPNHLHGILILTEQLPDASVGAGLALPNTNVATRLRLGSVVGAFKSLTAIQANRYLGRSERPFWQRGFYEHIIRDEGDMERVRAYIQQNPFQWATDTDNPTAPQSP